MGIFDIFKGKSEMEEILDEMYKIMWPNGRDDIEKGAAYFHDIIGESGEEVTKLFVLAYTHGFSSIVRNDSYTYEQFETHLNFNGYIEKYNLSNEQINDLHEFLLFCIRRVKNGKIGISEITELK